jgi:RNA ligase
MTGSVPTFDHEVKGPHLDNMFDPAQLAEMIELRYVRTRRHPDGGLTVYNYTQLAQFQGMWNTVTRTCRGLIVDDEGFVVARPFSKFFNLGEHPEGSLSTGPVQVTDKLDGSLGILYPYGEGHRIATRGSFDSEQALHATALWQRRYAERFRPEPGITMLFEIIYPNNRIVVDYGDLDDLVLIGAVDICSGRSIPLEDLGQSWPGPVVEQFPYETLAEAMAAPVRPGREGLVVHFVGDDSDRRVKIKHDEYVRLHRLVTGVSERRVWEALSEGQDLSDWLEAVPDELFDFVTATRARLLGEFARLDEEVRTRFEELVKSLPQGWQRRDFAAVVSTMRWPLARTMYLALDGQPYGHLLWSHLRPAEHVPLFNRTEDAD